MAKGKAPSKSEIFATIAEKTELTRKQVAAVFENLTEVIKKSIGKNGLFVLPGLCKMVVKKKLATKERQGINPKTGEPITIKAKPATKVIRVRALKALKAMI